MRTPDALRAAEAEFAALDASDDGDDADVYGADDDMDFDALVDDIVEEMEAEDAAASADWNASDPRDGIPRRARKPTTTSIRTATSSKVTSSTTKTTTRWTISISTV